MMPNQTLKLIHAIAFILILWVCPSSGIAKSTDLLYENIMNNNLLRDELSETSGLSDPIRIRGKVVDELGNPLTGVSIQIKRTTNIITTDEDGNFILEADTRDTLHVTYVGYKDQLVPIRNRNDIFITMEAKEGSLNEVVVVAYGEQKKETITGAISSIQTKELVQSPASNLSVSLAGRLPGLTSIQTSGQPGREGVLLYLRGRGTINGQDPIVLVDGVERPLQFIDPYEVDNVTILKDASATALYGVRGANGVILVTTRRGVKGQAPRINFSAQYGLQQFTDHVSPVDANTFVLLANQAAMNDGLPNLPFSPEVIQKYKDGNDPLYPNINYWDMMVRDFVPQQKYDLNMSGSNSSGTFRYFVNAGYLRQSGQWKIDRTKYEAFEMNYDPSIDLKRYNFRSNIDIDLTKTLSAFMNIAGYVGKLNEPAENATDIFMELANMPSTVPGPLTPDGEVLSWDGSSKRGPYAMINRRGYRQTTPAQVLSSFGMKQNLDFITKGLAARFMVSFDIESGYTLSATRSWEYWSPVIINGEITEYKKQGGNNSPLSLSSGTNFQSKSNFQFFMDYKRAFGINKKHEVTGLAFVQQQELIRPNDRIPFNLIGTSARATYAYNSKYFFEFNMGYNGSEQFAKGKRFGFFPAYSAGWLVSNEDFLKDNKFITHLKMRGSYGKVGNDQLGGRRFLYLDDTHQSGGGYSGSLLGTISESFQGNPDISWEIAKKGNVGIELGLFDQLNFTADFFWERRDNILIGSSSTVPIFNGLPLGVLPPINQGNIKNQGYELTMSYQKTISNNLFITAKANFNFADNKVLYIGEVELPEDYAYRYRQQGFRLGQQWALLTDGFFNTQEELNNSGLTYNVGTSPRVGDFRYKDLNKDGIIDDKDMAPYGYSHLPRYTFGFASSINYKSFDLSFLFQGVSDVTTPIINGFGAGTGLLEQTNFYPFHEEAWTPERYQKGLPIRWPALSTIISSSELYGAVNSSFFIVNTSYIRLKNVEIGYVLPKKWTEKISSNRVRLFANGLNLITWDKVPFEGFDPENRGSLAYPNVRIYNVGIDFNF